MRNKGFLISLIEILFICFFLFLIYNKGLYIYNTSKIETNKVISKFNIREKNFYEKKWVRKKDIGRI